MHLRTQNVTLGTFTRKKKIFVITELHLRRNILHFSYKARKVKFVLAMVSEDTFNHGMGKEVKKPLKITRKEEMREPVLGIQE